MFICRNTVYHMCQKGCSEWFLLEQTNDTQQDGMMGASAAFCLLYTGRRLKGCIDCHTECLESIA